MIDLKKFSTEQKKSADYLLLVAGEIEPRFQMICNKLDFCKGTFFCKLPSNAYLDRLHDFDLNGILPATDLTNEAKILEDGSEYIPKCIFTTRGALKEELFDYLGKKKSHFAAFFSHHHVKILSHDCTRNEISELMCTLTPHIKFAIVEFDSSIKIMNELSFNEEMLDGVEKIHLSAYDGEAYLSWKKFNN